MTPRILVAGIGNIFLGDDGFGPEVVRRASERFDGHFGRYDGVRVVDYGIRGMHLAYDLLDGWDALVLVDAIPDRGVPGELRIFEADHESCSATVGLDAHSMDPAAVFAGLRALGGTPPRTVVIGCQAKDVGDGIGLSDPVLAAVPEAVLAVESVLTSLQSEAGAAAREG